MVNKKRLDQLIFDIGLADSRTKAQALIMAGQVLVDGKMVDKVGLQIDESTIIELKEIFPYVSRGALKLEKAKEAFDLDFSGKVVCDIGSSTGGFTDYSLQKGASKVYSIDVGRGQLDQKLRENPKVIVMERTDFRDVRTVLTQGQSLHPHRTEDIKYISENIDIFVCDVSFISLKKIIPKIAEIINSYSSSEAERNREVKSSPQGRAINIDAILLIKPQFEVGKKEADRGKGVITDPELHNKVISEIQDFALEQGFEIKGITPSSITGAKGNKEFLLWIRK